MNLSVRTAFLLMAAISASSVAPAQVTLGSEPLMEVDSTDAPAQVVPAMLTVETPTAADPFAPKADEAFTQDDIAAAPKPVRPSGDFNSMVAQMRSTSAGSSELECLAGAIYFESKSEPLRGQLAVGHVIANRTHSGRFPSSYCGVVYQRSQFSFVRGHSMPPIARGGMQWQNAVAIAKIVDQKMVPTPVANSLFFHARRVSPGWHLTRVATLGNHVFYR